MPLWWQEINQPLTFPNINPNPQRATSNNERITANFWNVAERHPPLLNDCSACLKKQRWKWLFRYICTLIPPLPAIIVVNKHLLNPLKIYLLQLNIYSILIYISIFSSCGAHSCSLTKSRVWGPQGPVFDPGNMGRLGSDCDKCSHTNMKQRGQDILLETSNKCLLTITDSASLG